MTRSFKDFVNDYKMKREKAKDEKFKKSLTSSKDKDSFSDAARKEKQKDINENVDNNGEPKGRHYRNRGYGRGVYITELLYNGQRVGTHMSAVEYPFDDNDFQRAKQNRDRLLKGWVKGTARLPNDHDNVEHRISKVTQGEILPYDWHTVTKPSDDTKKTI